MAKRGCTDQHMGVFRRWLIWFLPAFFMLYRSGIQIVPSMKIPYLKSYYLLSNFQIALLSTIYLIPFVFLQIPAGMLIDNYDIRKISTAAVILFGFGTILIFFSNEYHSYALYLLGHLCMGIATSTGFISTVYLANLWIEKKYYNLAIGITQMFSMLGVFIIIIIFNDLLSFVDWSILIAINIFFCFFLSALFWIFIVDVEKTGRFDTASIIDNLKILLRNRRLWFCALYVGCAFAHFIVLTSTWRVDFLEAHYHLSLASATVDNGYSIFGFIIGAPSYGLLASKRQNITPVIVISAMLEFIILFVCHFFITDLTLKSAFYFFLGLFTGAIVLCFALIERLVDKKMLATGIGLVNMFGTLIGMLLTPIVGELLDRYHGDYVKATAPVVLVTFFSFIMAICLWRDRVAKD